MFTKTSRSPLLLLFALAGCTESVPAPDLLIRGVTVVSAERDAPYGPVDVAITDSRISAIASRISTRGLNDAQIVEGGGRFLTPGLIDSHVHLSTIPGMHDGHIAEFPQIAEQARSQVSRSFLFHGFTTVIDLITDEATMAAWNGQGMRPHAYFAVGAPIMDGYPTHRVPKPARYRMLPHFLIDPARAEGFPDGFDPRAHAPAAVAERIAATGAVAIKAFHEDGFGGARDIPVPSREVLEKLVTEGQRHGLPVVLHANSESAQAAGVEAGVDLFAHGLWTWDSADAPHLTPRIRAILDGIIEKGIAWQPTIQVLYGERDLFDPEFLSRPDVQAAVPRAVREWQASDAGQWLTQEMREVPSVAELEATGRWRDIDAEPIRHVMQALAYLSARGGRLVFGSDTPSAPTYANPAGLNGRLEMNHWIAAGVSPKALLHAATVANAELFGLLDEVGTVEVGKRADMLLLEQNPYDSLSAYDTIELVVLAGRVLPRATLAADAR